jgi:hypothetical protein
MGNEFESMNIGKRIFGLYIVKKNSMFESIHLLVPYSTAVHDFVHGTEAFDGTKTSPGNLVTEKEAKERLAKLTGDEEGRIRDPRELLKIRLNIAPTYIEYRGKVCAIPNAELLTHYDLYREMALAVGRLHKTDRLTQDFNALAVVFERETGAIAQNRSKSGRIRLKDLKPVPDPRVCLEDRCEIHKVRLKLFRPIYEFYVPKYQGW